MQTIAFMLALAAQPTTPLHMCSSLNHISFRYYFPNTPLIQGIKNIHSIEHLCTVHRLAAPCFRLKKVHPPKLTKDSSSILFECSTLLANEMCALMFATRPTESNILFITGKRMVYNVQLTVKPMTIDGFENSHSLKVDITFLIRKGPLATFIRAFLPLYLAVPESELLQGATTQENPHFTAYRNWVMRGIINLL